MFSSSTLLNTVLVAISVAASPITIRDDASSVTLPFAVNLNLNGTTLAELDRNRAAFFMQQGEQMDHANVQDPNATDSTNLSRRASTVNVTNTAVTYTTTVGVGSPATDYNLLIDTGSSNTWVGASKPYSQTSSSKATGGSITVNYGSGKMVGNEYTDTVSLSDSLVIDKQMIGVATLANGVSNGVDGILGLGPVALTSGTVTGSQKIPTVADNLYAQKKIKSEVIGISYNPTTTTGNKNGELTFGDIDKSKYTGDITYTPITKSSPAKNYWGIDQSITYGSSGQNILSSTAGIVDTGTTLTLLASDAFSRYESATGATLDGKTGLLKITNDQYEKLQSLYFNIGNTKFELTANAQIWPRALNKYIGGFSDGIYLIIADLGTNKGKGLDFINGYSFLERFYSVYDTTNNRVGIANTANTKVTVN